MFCDCSLLFRHQNNDFIFSKLFIHLTQSILDTYYCHFFFHQFSLCEIEMISHATIYCWAGALFCLLQSFFSFLLKLMLLLAFAKNVTFFFRFYIWIKENFFTISCSTFFVKLKLLRSRGLWKEIEISQPTDADDFFFIIYFTSLFSFFFVYWDIHV